MRVWIDVRDLTAILTQMDKEFGNPLKGANLMARLDRTMQSLTQRIAYLLSQKPSSLRRAWVDGETAAKLSRCGVGKAKAPTAPPAHLDQVELDVSDLRPILPRLLPPSVKRV